MSIIFFFLIFHIPVHLSVLMKLLHFKKNIPTGMFIEKKLKMMAFVMQLHIQKKYQPEYFLT